MNKTYKILLSFFLILMSGMGFSQSVPSYVPTNGLVGWWGFNGNAQDGSGNGNHGTVNGATLTTDRFGNQNGAYDFTVSNYITVFGLYQTNILQYTIASWFKKSSLNSNTDGTVVSGSNLQQSPSGIRLNMGTINRFQFQVEDSPGQNGIIELFPGVNVNYCDGQWHHVVGTFYAQSGAIPSSSFKLFIDGVEVSTISNFMNWPSWDTTTYAPVNNGGRPVIIGNSGPNFTGGFLGELDDIGIWNRALSPQEITNLYNSQLPTQTSLCLPTITTTSPSSVGVNTVVIGGDISNDGGSSIVLRGICYSTSPNPNMGVQRTEDGSGIGSFNTVLRGLNPSTTYYARSYAKNSNGVVVYGNEVSFTTSASLPGVRCPGTPTVTDIDGNVYNTVQIGNQCWTQSNLMVSKYRNGDNIPTGLNNSQWSSTTSGSYGIYGNDPVNDTLFGKLYNHYAVTDSRGLCPTGWHVPTDGEWTTLENHLGGSSVAGGALKSTAMQPTPGGWNPPNMGATNSSDFTALPGGIRHVNGDFYGGNGYGYWWSSSVSPWSNAWYRNLGYAGSNILRNPENRTYGISVRCLKNALPQVNTSSVTNLTQSTALVTGEVISEGGQNTTRGFCYSTTSNPTVSNDTTMNGTGLGVYTDTLQNLTPLTTYYVRAYATNSLGTAYGNEVSFTKSSIIFGSNYAGGIVFYLDSTGQHGLVCAASDQGNFEWGCTGTDINGTSNAFGTGQANTNLILSGCSTRPIAASVCDDLVLNGYSDWYLPSLDELQLMYLNLRVQGIGVFSTWYWSSSQFNPYDAWAMLFDNGNVNNHGHKLNYAQVRAVRAF